MTEMISIVIPLHNGEKYIKQTVESVLAQTYKEYELIIVNDHSTDASLSVAKKLAASDERIVVVDNEGEAGAAHARNEGIRLAKGRYLAYLDADDLWKAEKLEKTLRFLKSNNAAFVFTAYEFGDREAVGTGKVVHVPKTMNLKQAYSRTVIFTSTVMLDLKKIGKESAYMPYIKSEDTASWWNLLKAGYTAYGLDENLVVYRRAGQSLSSNKIEALRRIWNLYRKIGGLNVLESAWYFCGWAVRAVARRL